MACCLGGLAALTRYEMNSTDCLNRFRNVFRLLKRFENVSTRYKNIEIGTIKIHKILQPCDLLNNNNFCKGWKIKK